MDEALLNAMREKLGRADALHVQHTAELERSIAGQRELLRDLVAAAMRLPEINAPRDPADTVVIEDVVRRASKVLDRLEPPS